MRCQGCSWVQWVPVQPSPVATALLLHRVAFDQWLAQALTVPRGELHAHCCVRSRVWETTLTEG